MVVPLFLQALVDRPDETRRVMNFKRLALTDHKLDVPRLAKKKAIKKALESNGEQLQTCSAGAPPRQGAHMPCHRVGGGALSQTFQCMIVQHLQSAANRCQAHCQQTTKSGGLGRGACMQSAWCRTYEQAARVQPGTEAAFGRQTLSC